MGGGGGAQVSGGRVCAEGMGDGREGAERRGSPHARAAWAALTQALGSLMGVLVKGWEGRRSASPKIDTLLVPRPSRQAWSHGAPLSQQPGGGGAEHHLHPTDEETRAARGCGFHITHLISRSVAGQAGNP